MTVGAERGEIAEVGSPVLVAGPVDGDAIDARRSWRWTTTIIVVAVLFLAAFNAGTAVDWLDERTPTPVVERLRGPVEGWNDATHALGLDTGRQRLRGWWQRARAARFGDERAGEPGAG